MNDMHAREQAIQDLQEEINKLKSNLDEFCKGVTINHSPTESIQRYTERIKGLNDFIESLISTRPRKKRSTPYMVAGGDSEGKVTYTYPTGNSEDY